MRILLAVLVCLVIPCAYAGDGGYKIDYDGGSIPNAKSGDDLKLYIESTQVRITRKGATLLVLPPSAITEISYGQDVHRRIGGAIALGAVTLGGGALLALTKSKKHYIGITWNDSGKKGGAAFQPDKGDYRGVLTGLEGVTGKKTVNSENMSVKN
jgi:hypothetical protein